LERTFGNVVQRRVLSRLLGSSGIRPSGVSPTGGDERRLVGEAIHAEPVLNANDFICFLMSYTAGCS
jgi:hypothetical protein